MESTPEFVGEPGAVFDGSRIDGGDCSSVLEPSAGGEGMGPMGKEDLRRALLELRAIHRVEQSLLLAQAAEFRLAAVQRSVDRFPLLGSALNLPSQARWRRALDTERRFAYADGVPLARPLGAFCTQDPRVAPGALDPRRLASGAVRDAVRLASDAVALEPWPEARLTLARAWAAFGARGAAVEQLDAIDETPGIDWTSPQARALRTAVLGARAACAEMAGELDVALEGFLVQLRRNPNVHSAAMILVLALGLEDSLAFETGSTAMGILQTGSHSRQPHGWPLVAACIRSHRRGQQPRHWPGAGELDARPTARPTTGGELLNTLLNCRGGWNRRVGLEWLRCR